MRMRSISVVLLLLLLLLALAAPAARADDLKEQARRDVAAALEAQREGRYTDAIALFGKGYEAVPHPELLYNLGQAHRLVGDPVTALGYYRRYLAIEPSGRVAADARRWVAQLETIVASEEFQRAEAERARRAEDERRAAEAERARAAEAERAAEAAREDEQRRREDARVAEAAQRARIEALASRAEADRRSSRTATAIVVAASGGALLAGGLIVGQLARGKAAAAVELCGVDRRCDTAADAARANQLLDQSRLRAHASTALVAVGAAAAVGGGILWWTGRRRAVTVVAAPSQLGVAIGGAW